MKLYRCEVHGSADRNLIAIFVRATGYAHATEMARQRCGNVKISITLDESEKGVA